MAVRYSALPTATKVQLGDTLLYLLPVAMALVLSILLGVRTHARERRLWLLIAGISALRACVRVVLHVVSDHRRPAWSRRTRPVPAPSAVWPDSGHRSRRDDDELQVGTATVGRSVLSRRTRRHDRADRRVLPVLHPTAVRGSAWGDLARGVRLGCLSGGRTHDRRIHGGWHRGMADLSLEIVGAFHRRSVHAVRRQSDTDAGGLLPAQERA